MAKILCLETSTEVCSVVIAENGKVSDVREDQSGLNHSRLLTVFIDELLKSNNLSVSDFDAVAVSEGPGSYTGLRIGVSVAKGLCFGATIPLIAISPLKAMAASVIAKCSDLGLQLTETDCLVPMIDARRMEVYRAIYSFLLKELSKVDAVVIDENTFAEALNNHRLIFFGNGAEKCKPVIEHANAYFVEGIITSAANMATLANEKFIAGQFVDLAYFEPFYLKDFVATIAKNSVLKGL